MKLFVSGWAFVSRVMAVAAVAVVLFAAAPLFAQQDYWWIDAGGGPFSDADNWDPPGPPGTPDAAIFDLPNNYTVTFDQDHTNHRLVVDDGQVRFELGGWAYVLEHVGGGGDASVIIGRQSAFAPTLTLTGGNLLASACTLAVLSGGSGTVIVDGLDTTWTNQGDFTIGAMGSGSATFQNGGTANSYGNVLIGTETDGINSGHGEANLSGQDGQVTTWTIGDDSVYTSDLFVGSQGQGTINVNAYATLTMKEHDVDDQGNRSSGWVFVGSQTGSAGHVYISGEQAQFNVEHSPVLVGDWGDGDLHVLNGGRMWMGDGELWLATQAGSTGSVEVSGLGSTLEEHSAYASVVGMRDEGTLTIGDFGSASFAQLIVGQEDQAIGRILMASHGTLSSGYASLADQPGSYGEANIDQDAVWTVTDRMNVGRQGTADMSIWGGGKLDQTLGDTFALVLGADPDSEGTVTVEDATSRIDTAGELVIGQSGVGTMNVYSGAQVAVKQAHLATVAGSEGYLTVHGQDAGFQTTALGLLVGREGEGDLLVEESATMTLAGGLDLGEQPGGKGWVTVQSNGHIECNGVWLGTWGPQDPAPAAQGYLTVWGPGASLTSTAQILVGREGYGELLVGDTAVLVTDKGGSATGTSGVLGAIAGGTGVATVNNATWTQDGALVVGWSGTGTLNIQDWGLVASQSALIGRMSGATGTVTVAGDHAVWNVAEDMGVGGTMDAVGSTGSLFVNGTESHVRVGHAGSGGTLRVWQDGLVSLNQGRMVVGSDVLGGPGTLWVAPLGAVDLRGGAIELTNMDVDGLLSGDGSIIGDVHVGGAAPAALSPGGSPGTITINGNLVLEGLAQFDITGHDPGQYDLVQQGTGAGPLAVTFGGTLELRFTGTYSHGDQWLIFDFDQYNDDFASVDWTGLPPDQAARFDPSTGIVRIVPVLVSSEPVADGTLPKTKNNVMLLTFSGPIALPGGPALSIINLHDSTDVSASFTYTLQTTTILNDTLKAKENATVLVNQKWYRVTPAVGFNVQPFVRDFCTLQGDADGNGAVLAQDYFPVKNHLFELTDKRYDLDGSGQVLAQDYFVVKNHLFQAKPPKP